MKVSSKTRYALGILILLSQNDTKPMALSEMAKQLGISKLYLEQVIAALKSHQMVQSIKGPQGGYTLSSQDYSVWDVFAALESDQVMAFEEQAFDDQRLNQLITDRLFRPFDEQTQALLSAIKLHDLARAYHDDVMFFI